jgi:hypothetical protein
MIPLTRGLTAVPDDTLRVPHETALPFWTALGLALMFAAMLLETALVAVVGLVVAGLAVLRWTWRTGASGDTEVLA